MNITSLFSIYCDENRQDLLAKPTIASDNNHFCCIGGIMIPASSTQRIKQRIMDIKRQYNVHGELKWGTVSANKVDFYLALVDLFFDEVDLSFRTIVIDAKKIDNQTYNSADQELGYYKFYYQLIYHWMTANNEYRIYTDQKTNRDKLRLKDLRTILNNSYGVNSPVQMIQPINSKESVILQLENVLMGAVGYKFNNPSGDCLNAKKMVVKRIEERLGHEIRATYKTETKFNVFVINLRGGC